MNDGYKAVDYSRLTALLVEAVKELKSENEDLKKALADAILFGDLQKGGLALVECDKKGIVIRFPETETA